MTDGSLQSRRLFTRAAFAFLVPWIGVLLAIILLHPLLIFVSIPALMLAGFRQVAESLMLLSVVVVPWMTFVHTRLCKRNRLGIVVHVNAGMVTASAFMALMWFAQWQLEFGLPPLSGPLFSSLSAAVIGALCGAVVWVFVVKPLRPKQDIARIFE